MTRSRKRRIREISQRLSKHEKRMTDALNRRLTLLGREIDARWGPNPEPIVLESVLTFERTLSSIIFRFGINAAGDSGTSVLDHLQTKASMEIMMVAIRRWLRGYSDERAHIIANYLRDQIHEQFNRGLTDQEVRANVLRIVNRKGSAERIANTETHTAIERGAFEAAQYLGV